MRDLTTNWNAAAYYNSTVFVDSATGNTMTIGADRPVDVRTMNDSVQAGQYKVDVDSCAASDATLATAVNDVDVVTVTVTLSSVAQAGYPVKASSSDVAKATVSPALGFTKADGTVDFTITSVATGSATITYTAGTATDTTAVTVS